MNIDTMEKREQVKSEHHGKKEQYLLESDMPEDWVNEFVYI